jgi:hypothetical protein
LVRLIQILPRCRNESTIRINPNVLPCITTVLRLLTTSEDCLTVVHDGLKIASRLEKIGSTPDCFEHVQNCREGMPMFQDLSRIMRNHHYYSRVSPRVYKNHPDCSSCGQLGQTSGQIEADSSRFGQFVTNRGKIVSKLIVQIRRGKYDQNYWLSINEYKQASQCVTSRIIYISFYAEYTTITDEHITAPVDLPFLRISRQHQDLV